jgi:hypothetical protein
MSLNNVAFPCDKLFVGHCLSDMENAIKIRCVTDPLYRDEKFTRVSHLLSCGLSWHVVHAELDELLQLEQDPLGVVNEKRECAKLGVARVGTDLLKHQIPDGVAVKDLRKDSQFKSPAKTFISFPTVAIQI